MPVGKNSSLNLDSLGALIGTTYTVQEIHSYPNILKPKVENGVFVNNGDYVEVGGYNSGAIGALLYGDLNSKDMSPLSGAAHAFRSRWIYYSIFFRALQ